MKLVMQSMDIHSPRATLRETPKLALDQVWTLRPFWSHLGTPFLYLEYPLVHLLIIGSGICIEATLKPSWHSPTIFSMISSTLTGYEGCHLEPYSSVLYFHWFIELIRFQHFKTKLLLIFTQVRRFPSSTSSLALMQMVVLNSPF